ncbi:hypothetical protein HFC64_04490 [Saccharolobus solfataricus]|uniref:Uncharacterized protein n=1 Tax=Saccharolobus solfataricus TaxID=2287 RepID=A0A7S9IHG4_SACSO|nr:hypothetical protein [Saccharolobus solfataricus]QPG49210.1 hypothetical protein HFC64_04490 [Saccharolobus solfataricus]
MAISVGVTATPEKQQQQQEYEEDPHKLACIILGLSVFNAPIKSTVSSSNFILIFIFDH